MRPLASRFSFLSLTAAAALMLGGTSEAALIVWESFDYPADSGNDWNFDGKYDLHGLNGGQGFAGPWREELFGMGPTSFAYDYINAGNVVPPTSVGDLKSNGNSLLTNISATTDTQLWRELAPIDLSAPRTLWMGFLSSRVSGTSNASGSAQWFLLTLAPSDSHTSEVDRLYVGDYLAHDFVLYAPHAEDVQSTGYAPADGEVTWLVVKMEFNPTGNDRFELFVNPTPGTTPTEADAVLTSLDLPELKYLGVRAMSSTGAKRQWSLDEIRIGDTFQDVSVPEPATGVMSLLGAAALGFRRRRR